MKRVLDLIREILIRTEEMQSPSNLKVEGRSDKEVCYNVRLAEEHGLLVAKFPSTNSDMFHIIRLTYEGHEFLDAARSEKVWTSAKETMLNTAGAVTLEGLKIALKQAIAHALGHPV